MENNMDIKKILKKKAVFAANGAGTMAANGVEPQDAPVVAGDGDAAANQASLRPGSRTGMAPVAEDVQFDVSDFAAALFEGEELSESFQEKCITIFEAAINEKIAIIEASMLEAAKTLVEAEVSRSVSVISEGVDKYLTYVCEEWMTENNLAVETGMKNEIVENFIYGLKDLFENSYIDVPDEKYNVVDELFEANSELESKINSIVKENIDLRNTIVAHQCAEVFVEAASGLADTEVEKLASLAEGIEFDSIDQYRDKVKVLRDSYFNGTVTETVPYTTSTVLGESVSSSTRPIIDNSSEMDAYVRTLSAQLKLTNNKPSL
jgi:hypothetical protein